MPRVLRLAPFVCLSFALLLSGSAQAEEPLLSRDRELGVMGTDLVLRAYGSDGAVLDAALDAAILEIQRVEDEMTDWRPSPLMDLNAAAGSGPTVVDPELFSILERSLELAEVTDGAFDISFAAAGRLWSFEPGGAAIPDSATVTAALAHVGFRRIHLDAAERSVDLPAGMRVGLGGIAKGYGVDRAMAVLMEHGVEHGVVNAGGDMKVLGLKNGEPWEIAIKHPRDRDRVLALLRVSNTCVVTSGDYERFFEIEGKRYHHILDPRTGYPSTGCLSATVIAPSARDADALATACCVLGPDEALRLVELLPRTEALLVGMDGVVHTSSGLEGLTAGD